MRTRRTKKAYRNAALKEEYDRLKKMNKYRPSYIIKVLSDKFFLTEKTVEQVVYEIGHYQVKIPVVGDQLKLF